MTTRAPADVGPKSARLRATDLRGQRPTRRLRGRNFTKADILVYRHDGIDIAVKDYTARPWLIRNILGRWSIRRETAAYEAAGDIAGLPEFLGRLGPYTLAVRWIEARQLKLLGGTVDSRAFDRVGEILEALHARGVAIADLHHRNVLFDRNGEPFLVDLATAWIAGAGAGRFRRTIFVRFREADRVALARLRARAAGRDPDAAVAEIGGSAATWYRRARRVRRWYNWLRTKLS